MKKLDRQRKITLMALSMALVVAVYLNWQYSRTDTDTHIMTGGQSDLEQTDTLLELDDDTLDTQTNADAEINPEGDLLETNLDETKNYGDAQLVASTAKSAKKYFEETRLSRQKSRDEALDTLQKTLKSAKISDAEKKNATAELSQIIQNITTETDVENLVKAKGFVDCAVFKNADKITVAVQTKSGDLTKQDAAQVRDIVLNKTDVNAQNIVVIEVK